MTGLRLLWLISWPYARRHALRSVLTAAGIVLGVAVFVGMHTANQSVLAAFHQTIDRIAGSTQLQVSAGEPGFEEEVLDRIRDTPGVRAAAPVIEATVSVGTNNVLLLGVDMLGDRNLRNYDFDDSEQNMDDPLVFLAQPDSLILTKSFSEENGLKPGARVPMKTMAGNVTFTIRGLMKPGGMAAAFGGNLAIMDIYAAQKILGRGRRFDRVDLAVDEGVDIGAITKQLAAKLGPGFQVEPPSSRGQQFEATARMYTLASNLTSLFALFIGMFIIYNTFAIAVTQRRNEIGVLRALGATQGQIRTLFLTESAIVGLAGTVLGIVMGILMAQGMTTYISGMLSEIYGVSQQGGDARPPGWLLAAAVLMGVVTSLIAGVLPARSAAAVDPVKALQKGRANALTEGESRTRRRWALVCAVLSLAAFLLSRYALIFYAGFLLAILAAVLLSPAMSLWLARLLRPLMAAIRPVEGALAADSLIQAPRRTSGTIAALMLSLALVISLGGLARASYTSLTDWMNVALNPDLFVTTAQNATARSFVFPASLGEGLRSVAGIAEVQFVRSVRVVMKGVPVMIVALDIGSLARRASLPPLEGNTEEMYRTTAAGKGVIISENFAQLQGAKFGEMLEIPSPNGILRLPIVGVVVDYSDQQGSILLARQTYIDTWHDDTVNIFRIYLEKGAQEARVRQEILSRFGQNQRLFVLTNQDVRDFVNRITEQWWGMTYVQIGVAVLVAILGIINALTVSITDRRRELGVLQAVGALRNQIRLTIWMEAVAIGVIGLVLGLALGAIQLWYSVEVTRRDIIGINIGYAYPYNMAWILAPVILAAALLAALAPAESAVRGSLVEALEYE